ncbi:hypothetical protein, partial [Methylobacterium isbiliense]
MRLAISYIATLCLIAVLLVYSYQWMQQPSSALLKSRDEVAAEIELGWRGAKGIPFNVSAGIEIARQDANQAWSTLIFVCDGAGVFHLILRTRLPVPDDFRGNDRPPRGGPGL